MAGRNSNRVGGRPDVLIIISARSLAVIVVIRAAPTTTAVIIIAIAWPVPASTIISAAATARYAV